jgi:hypothetical protein
VSHPQAVKQIMQRRGEFKHRITDFGQCNNRVVGFSPIDHNSTLFAKTLLLLNLHWEQR